MASTIHYTCDACKNPIKDNQVVKVTLGNRCGYEIARDFCKSCSRIVEKEFLKDRS